MAILNIQLLRQIKFTFQGEIDKNIVLVARLHCCLTQPTGSVEFFLQTHGSFSVV